MTPEMIGLIVKIAFIVFFVLLVLGIIGAAKRGAKKGIYRTTFNLVWTAVIFLIAFLCLDKVVEIVGKIGLEMTGYKSVVITRADGVYYVAKVTTIKETLVDAFKGYYLLYGINGSYQAAATSAYAIVEAILKYVLYLVLVILILIVGTLLREIFWAIFKKCVPSIAKKKNKVKAVAAMQNVFKHIALTVICASPFTSLLNTLNIAYSKVDTSKFEEQQGIVAYIDSALTSYNDSIFAQALFNWNVDENGMSFDSQFMNFVTGSTVEDLTVSLTETITGIVNIGTTALDVLDLSNGFGVNYSALLSGATIQALLQSISESQIISLIIPVAMEMAMNEELLKVNTSLIDVSEMSLEEELGHVGSIIDAVVETGILDLFIDGSGNFATSLNLNQLLDKVFDPENKEHISEIFNQIKESKLIGKLLPAVVYTFANQSASIGTYLPTNWDEITDIDWGFELKVVFDNLFELLSIDGCKDLILGLLGAGTGDDEPIQESRILRADDEPVADNTLSQIIEFAVDNISAVKNALVGDGSPTDANGRTIVYVDGVKQEGKSYCLADCSMFKKAFLSLDDLLCPKIAELGFDSENKLPQVFAQMNTGNWRKNYKNEFGAIFNCLETFDGQSDVIVSLINNFDLNSLDEDVVDLLKEFLPKVDNSNILETCFGGFLSTQITNLNETLEGIGLDGSLVKAAIKQFTNNKVLGAKLVGLVSSITDVLDIMDILNGDTSNLLGTLSEGDTYKSLAKVLDALYNSEIINPTYYYEGSDIVIVDKTSTHANLYKDTNYLNVLDYLFNDLVNMPGLSFDRAIVQEAVNGKWANSYDDQGNMILDGENGKIANIIHVLGTCKKGDMSILDALNDSSTLGTNAGIASLATDYHVGDFLRAVAESEVFKSMMGAFLDTQLDSVGILDPDNNISFANVTDWTAEANNLESLLINIGKIDISFDGFDITAAQDVANLNNLLHSLANSGMFSYKNTLTNTIEYKFGTWLYGKLASALGSFSIGSDSFSLIADPTSWNDAWGEKDNTITDNILKFDFSSLNQKADWFSTNYDFTLVDDEYYTNTGADVYWQKADFLSVYNDVFELDEIGRLCKVIFYVTKISGVSDLLSLTSSDFSGLLLAINDCKCLRVCIYNIYAQAQSIIKGTSEIFNLDASNIELLIAGNKTNSLSADVRTWRANEIDCLASLFDLFTTLTSGDDAVIQGSTFSLNAMNSKVINKLSDTIVKMSQSDVFHRAGPASVDSNKAWNPSTLQELLFTLTGNEDLGLAAMLYNEDNPKDIKLASTYQPYALTGDTTEASSKMRYIISNAFAYGLSNASSYADEEEEIENFFNVLKTCAGGDLPDVEAIAVSALPAINTTTVGSLYKVSSAITTDSSFIEGAGLSYPAGCYVKVILNSGSERKYDVIAGLVNSYGNTSFDFGDIDFSRSDNSKTIVDVLKAMSDSVLLQDAAPNAIYANLESLNVGSFSYIKIANANVYHNYYTNGIDSTIDDIDVNATFSENDYETLEYLLQQVALQNSGQDCDIPSFSNISDFSLENDPQQTKIAGLENFVNTLIDSEMFHKAGPSLKLSSSNFTVSYKDDAPRTFVQGVFLELFHNSSVEGMLYNAADTAKNTAKGYTSAAVKIDSIVSSTFAYNGDTTDQKAEFAKICAFIVKASELTDLDFSGGITSIDTVAVKDLLLALNDTDTMFDAIPNLMHDIFGKDFSGFDGVSFSDANAYYAYLRDGATANYDAKYDEEEITTICNLIDHFKQLNEAIGNSGLGDLSSISSMTAVGGDGESLLTNLLKDAYNSHILHKSNEYLETYDHLTVFEQIINTLVNKSTMDSYIFNYDDDGFADAASMMKFYIKKVTLSEVGKITLADDKLANALLALDTANIRVRETGKASTQSYIIVESKDLTNALNAINNGETVATGVKEQYTNNVGYHTSWSAQSKDDEIHALNSFLNTAGSTMGGSGSLSFGGGSGLSLSSLSPDKVSSLMEAINKVDIISKAVPAFIKTGFESIGFNSKTTYNSKDVTNYNIGQKGFGGTGDISASANSKAEINLVKNVLSALATYDGDSKFTGYASMGGDFLSSISGDGLTSIFDFLGESKMLTTGSANFVTSVNTNGLTAKANGLVLYNLLDASALSGSDTMVKYITGGNSDQKLAVLTRLMNDSNTSSAAEAKAIKYIVADSANLASAGDSDMSSLSNNSSLANALVNCMRNAYRGGSESDNANTRAFVSSDIIANIYNTLLDTEISNITANSSFYYDTTFRFGKADYAEIVNSNDLNGVFADVCELEANGVEAGLELIGSISGSVDSWDTTAMQSAFNKMDNGKFAKILYLSRVHSPIRSLMHPGLCAMHSYTPNVYENSLLEASTSPLYTEGFTFKSVSGTKGYGELLIEDINEARSWAV